MLLEKKSDGWKMNDEITEAINWEKIGKEVAKNTDYNNHIENIVLVSKLVGKKPQQKLAQLLKDVHDIVGGGWNAWNPREAEKKLYEYLMKEGKRKYGEDFEVNVYQNT